MFKRKVGKSTYLFITFDPRSFMYGFSRFKRYASPWGIGERAYFSLPLVNAVLDHTVEANADITKILKSALENQQEF